MAVAMVERATHHDGAAERELDDLALEDDLVDHARRQEAVDDAGALLPLAVDTAVQAGGQEEGPGERAWRTAHRAIACRSFDGFQSLSTWTSRDAPMTASKAS